MAPYQSLLPVRRGALPPSALPRSAAPLPTRSSNFAPPAVHAPQTPGKSILDLSRFDLDGLLDSRDGSEAGDLLRDEAEPSWLADQSAFTLAARTPARGRVENRLDDESMLPEGAFYDEEEREDEDQVVLATFERTVSAQAEQEQAPSPAQHLPPSPSTAREASSPAPTASPAKSEQETAPSPSASPPPPAKPLPVRHRPSLVRLPQGPAHPPILEEEPIVVPAAIVAPAVAVELLPKVEEEEEDEAASSAPPPSEDQPAPPAVPAQPTPPAISAAPTAPGLSPPAPAPLPAPAAAPPAAPPKPLARSLPSSRAPPPPTAKPAAALRASLAPAPGPAPAAKKPPGAKGVPAADEAARQRVREAKAERERVARERRERVEREVEERRGRGREEKGKGKGKGREVPAVEQAAQEKRQPAPYHAVVSAVACSASTSAEPLDDLPAPAFAFDADSSLPPMGAPLELASPVRDALGAELRAVAGAAGVTSTPARPMKRKASEEPVEEDAPQEAPEKRKARRTTIAVQGAPAALQQEGTSDAVKVEPQREILAPAPAPVEPRDKTRRHPSRVSLAPPAATDFTASTSAPSSAPLVARPSKGKAVRVSLLPPIPDDRPVDLVASTSSAAPSLSRSQRRASRVSFALAPAPVLLEESAEETQAGLSTSLSASTSRRRTSRISLAPPPPTPPSAHVLASVVEVERAEDTLARAPDGLKASTRRASRVFAIVEEEVEEAAAPAPAPISLAASLPASHPAPAAPHNSLSSSTSRALAASAACALSSSACRAPTPSVTAPAPPARATSSPVRAPPPGLVLGGVTLPSSFSFAESATAVEREAEKARRAEERERREKAAERVLEDKKRKREGEGAWSVAVAGAQGKKEDDRAKRARLAASLAHSTSSAPPEHAAACAALSSSPPRAVHAPAAVVPAVPASPAPALPAAAPVPPAVQLAPEPAVQKEPLALTREALERNTRRAGPKASLERRVSLWALEGVSEEEEQEGGELPMGEKRVMEECEQVKWAVETRRDEPEEVVEAPTPVAEPHPAPEDAASAVAPLAPPAPTAPAPVPARAKPAAAAPPRTTAPAPFRFASTSRGAPNATRQPLAPSAAAQPASPMFTARLGAWKARERVGTGPAPALAKGKAQEKEGARVRKALDGAAPAPVAKRARVAAAPQGKENAPAPVPASAPTGVAAELERLARERMEWSERQKKREEEVRRRREKEREEEAERERNKLKQLRASLARGGAPAAKTGGVRRAGRV
ncbi:hypothetical protein JCM10450v2_000206 [Rhodotorula kratochvilovae]